MARRNAIAATGETPASLTCVVTSTVADCIRELAWQQRRSISNLMTELLQEALDRRGINPTAMLIESAEATKATA